MRRLSLRLHSARPQPPRRYHVDSRTSAQDLLFRRQGQQLSGVLVVTRCSGNNKAFQQVPGANMIGCRRVPGSSISATVTSRRTVLSRLQGWQTPQQITTDGAAPAGLVDHPLIISRITPTALFIAGAPPHRAASRCCSANAQYYTPSQ